MKPAQKCCHVSCQTWQKKEAVVEQSPYHNKYWLQLVLVTRPEFQLCSAVHWRSSPLSLSLSLLPPFSMRSIHPSTLTKAITNLQYTDQPAGVNCYLWSVNTALRNGFALQWETMPSRAVICTETHILQPPTLWGQREDFDHLSPKTWAHHIRWHNQSWSAVSSFCIKAVMCLTPT